MKICLFCGTEAADSAATCAACGANQFKNKCNNCGTVFEEGAYCPSCGVKAGETAKRCPRCGKNYFSAACPDCGYLPGAEAAAEPRFDPAVLLDSISSIAVPEKKRRTWLWVLGWIFCYPIPLTVLIFRGLRYLYRKYKHLL